MKPTKNKCEQQLRQNNCVPVYEEIYADGYTPIMVLKKLKEQGYPCFLLESVTSNATWSRYSFLGFNPLFSLKAHKGIVSKQQNGQSDQIEGNASEIITAILKQYQTSKTGDANLPTFTGGFVGNFSYEYVKNNYHLPNTPENEVGIADFDLMFFDKIIAFDHLMQKIYIIAHASIKHNISYEMCQSEISEINKIITTTKATMTYPSKQLSEIRQRFTEAQYKQMVKQAKVHILDGDIFQIVIANRFEMDFFGDLLSTYRVLRTTNPSPYMFYLDYQTHQIAGASPETLISLKGENLATFPIAGTCPRGKTVEEDEQLIAQLLGDEKELAEHNMLVDLGRNDLGKISKFGSVRVTDYQKVLKFSHVSHITSTVTSKLAQNVSPMDAIDALTPAGTLSGAPKNKAMELIGDLEKASRGVYGGAIGYLALNGDLDLCIAIRLAIKKDEIVSVSAGAGIVMDSNPTSEYNECLNKAKSMLRALSLAEGVE
ncbi:MAG: anthranilate synthase component I family protein [Culicoidibacterales bacterium]